ncbi:MAG: TolC family protein [Bacteroidales bacterium]|nr:TolC family protein [Bacteroidales bacterium]
MRRTKFAKFLVAVVATLFVSSSVMAQDTLYLSLDDALKVAMSENISVKVADKEIKRTEYARKGTYASLFPQVDFSGAYQRAIKKQKMHMNMGGQEMDIEVGVNNTWSTGFSAAMPLVNVQLWKAIQITGMDVELAVEKAKGSRQDLIDQVQQSFYGVLLAKELYSVYKENYDNAKDNYNDVKAKYDAGLASKFEFLSAEVAMQNAEPNVFDAQNGIVLANWKLKAVLGIDLDQNIECTGSLSDYEGTVAGVAAYENVSVENNSTVKQLNIQEQMLQKNYEMQLAKYYPTLAAQLSYNWVAMSENFKFSEYKWNPYSTGALALSIPIFAGGQKQNQLRQTRIQQEQLALQKEDAIRQLEVSVKQVLNSLETSLKQYEAAQKTIEGAQAGYEIAKKRYDVGSGTLLELQEAQLGLLQARLNVNQSVYTYMILKSSLDKILGVNQIKQ